MPPPPRHGPARANAALAATLAAFVAAVGVYCARAIGQNEITDDDLRKFKILKKKRDDDQARLDALQRG